MKTSKILTAAAKLIDTPEKWAKGCYARDSRGNSVARGDAAASSFCSIGAVDHTSWELDRGDGSTVTCALSSARARAALEAPAGGSVVAFNDAPDTTHGDVMTAFALAIAIAEDAGD